MRIVSLLPSATEIICHLGLRAQLVGVTHECDYPPSVAALPKVTTTLIPSDASSRDIDQLVRERLTDSNALYSLNMEALEAARPDLIVTQALCNVCAVAEQEVSAAASRLPSRPQVINLEPMCLGDVLDTVTLLGRATDNTELAVQKVAALRARIAAVQNHGRALSAAQKPKVAFLEWIDPPFNAGHWTPEIIELAGGIDCLGNKGQPSTAMAWQKITAAEPEVLFIALCGFNVARTRRDIPLLESHPGWGELPCARQRRVYITDGSAYFSRSGPRLVDSLEIMAHALHPDIHPLPAGLPAATRL